MTTFEKAPADVLQLVAEAIRLYHPRLNAAGVDVSVLMAIAGVDENGDPSGPALKSRGQPCFATIRINPLRLRVQGLGDAELMIADDRWALLSREERLAVLDHELTHLELVGDVDDRGRPKLKLRRHDFEVGWFIEVAARHKTNSQESQQIRAIVDEHGQVLFAFTAQEKAA